MISVCVPVLRRYDLLENLCASLARGSVVPDRICVIDNGGRNWTRQDRTIPDEVFTPHVPMGIAESWNWFIKNVPEERVIVNDDVIFRKDSLLQLVMSKADLVWATGCGFSCFVLRDSCVTKIGLFDETISPGYGYYEDDDYLQRLDGRGTRAPSAIAENVDCGIVHLRSQTLQAASPEDQAEHHRKFLIAQKNYMAKWGIASL